MCSGSRKETGYLLHPSAEDKREGLRILGSSRILSHLDTGYSSLAKPLYEATAGSRKDPLNWRPDQEKTFQEIKRLLTSTPVLGLPDVAQLFNPFICEKNHTPLGPHSNCGTMALASGLLVQMLSHGGLRVASMSLSPGCYGNLNPVPAHPGTGH
jgi:hypothetical protein